MLISKNKKKRAKKFNRQIILISAKYTEIIKLYQDREIGPS